MSLSEETQVLEPEAVEPEEDLAEKDLDFDPEEETAEAAGTGTEEPKTKGTALALPPSSSVAVADPLARYLWEISQYDLLSREKELEVARRYRQTGDAEAAATLVKANLRLVVKIAMDFQRFWMKNLLDLIQEGNIGLMQAVKKFDPFRGIKFSYYASFWIKAYVLKFIMDNWKLVKVGTTQAQRRLFYNLKKEKERLQAQGFEATPKLLAQNLNVKEEEVVDMDQRLGSWELSLEAPLRDDSGDQFKDFLPSDQPTAEDVVAGKELRLLLSRSLSEFRSRLSGKELIIFDQRIMADPPATLQEVGQKFNISRERVRQIQSRLVKKIKEFLESKIPDLKDSLEGYGR